MALADSGNLRRPGIPYRRLQRHSRRAAALLPAECHECQLDYSAGAVHCYRTEEWWRATDCGFDNS